MYSRMSWEATCGLMPAGAQHGRGRLMRPNRASSANMIRRWRPRLAAAARARLTARAKPFFKGILRLNVTLRMKRTRHQLAPAMPVEEIIDGAVAGRMADRLLIGALEVVDVSRITYFDVLASTPIDG